MSINAEQATFDTSQTSSVVNIDRDRVEELPFPNWKLSHLRPAIPASCPGLTPALVRQTRTQNSGGFSQASASVAFLPLAVLESESEEGGSAANTHRGLKQCTPCP